jgi:hypothetical protein
VLGVAIKNGCEEEDEVVVEEEQRTGKLVKIKGFPLK